MNLGVMVIMTNNKLINDELDAMGYAPYGLEPVNLIKNYEHENGFKAIVQDASDDGIRLFFSKGRSIGYMDMAPF